MEISEENLTLDAIRQLILNYKNDPDYQKLSSFYYAKSFSEILKISRRELSHSSFLAWLFDFNESHGLGHFAVQKLFDLVIKFGDIKNVNSKVLDLLTVGDYIVKNQSVFTEKNVIGVGKVDLYIELEIEILKRNRNIKFIIENKVGSLESGNQTERYFQYFDGIKKRGELIFYIYLTPISTLDLIELKEPECSCKNFIQMNYQSIVDYILEPALNLGISSKSRSYINEYLLSLSQPALDENSDNFNNKNGLIMALGKEERDLLASFWNKNQKLIMAALYAISSDPEQEKDTRDSINEALSNLAQEGRDKSKLNISYHGKYFVKNIKKSDLGLQTVKLLKENELIDEVVLMLLKENTNSGVALIKKREEFTETEIRYRRYRVNQIEPDVIINDEEYYVSRNWGINNIFGFIESFQERFPGLVIDVTD